MFLCVGRDDLFPVLPIFFALDGAVGVGVALCGAAWCRRVACVMCVEC